LGVKSSDTLFFNQKHKIKGEGEKTIFCILSSFLFNFILKKGPSVFLRFLHSFFIHTYIYMKYRRLKDIELEKLEKRFIEFLVSNTITGDDWKMLKEKDPERASTMIDIFSDMVFETTIKRIEFLKFREAKEIKLFKCEADKIILMGLSADETVPVDFTVHIDMKELMNHTAGLSIYRHEKKYKPNRDMELFRMLESGCQITDGHLFGIFEKLNA
jgi:hypothetical protein